MRLAAIAFACGMGMCVPAFADGVPPEATGELSNAICTHPAVPVKANAGLKAMLAFDGDQTGSLQDVRILQTSGYAELDDAAIACVKTWHFDPKSAFGKFYLGSQRLVIDWTLPNNPTQNAIGRRGGIPHSCPYYPQGVPPGTIGTTRVGFFITADGHVRDAHVVISSGNTSLDEESVRCTTYWRYRPAVKDGQPVEVPWQAEIAWKVPAEEQSPTP